MAMDKGIRKQILHWYRDQIKTRLKFPEVNAEQPNNESVSSLKLPAIFIFRSTSPKDPLTQIELNEEMLMHFIGIVEDYTGDVEAVKSDLEDDLTEIVYSDITVGGLAVIAHVTNTDGTAFSMQPLGISSPVLPPYGAIRMDIKVSFDYSVDV